MIPLFDAVDAVYRRTRTLMLAAAAGAAFGAVFLTHSLWVL